MIPLVLCILAAPPAALANPLFRRTTPAQLNVPDFARCLSQEVPSLDLEAERRAYHLGEGDLLLLYLSVYPGRRLPAPASALQDLAHHRWTGAFAGPETVLAQKFRSRIGGAREALSPAIWFRDALDACDQRPFCAALISHNVLRTLGRHEQAHYRDPLAGNRETDLNPRWFRSELLNWLTQIPELQATLMNLRPDRGGDEWGEWYHFFGILAFALHEHAIRPRMTEHEGLAWIVHLNEVLNPLLAGGPESAEKARLDQDSLQVALTFIRGAAGSNGTAHPCDVRSSYANTEIE